MTPATITTISIGELRDGLGWSSRPPMQAAWEQAGFGLLPADHVEVPCVKARRFVETLTEPKQGRSRNVTEAAKTLLAEFRCAEKNGGLNGTFEKVQAVADELQKFGNATFETLEKVENAFEKVSEPEKKVGFWADFARTFNPADLAYYACCAVGCWGIIQALPVVGWIVAAVVFYAAVIALLGVKTKTGWNRALEIGMLVFIEAVNFASHYVWANAALWRNVKALPVKLYAEKYVNGAGETIAFWQGEGVEMPHYVALAIAVIMAVCAAYVVAKSIQNKTQQP